MGSRDRHVVVVDVSSDEEVDTKVDRDYFDWLHDVMEADDEVEVISEVKGHTYSSKYLKKNSSVIQTVDDDDDDDCVILDCDPDKTSLGNDDDDDDDDDVVVVGQKGEIACRDFPHPRHSCAKYSFTSTSHDKYCDMCHCYVCDIPAPCPYWCIGVSTIDHCHANDKETIWKNQREYFRTGNMPTTQQQPSSKPATPLPASSPVTHKVSRSLIRLSQNTLTQNQVGLRSCSSSSRIANLSNVRARYRSKSSVPQNSPVQSLSSVRNNVIQKDRSSYMVNPRSRMASLRTRYGSTNGNNNMSPRLYTNAQASQPDHHSSSMVSPTVHPETYTQQQLDCAAATGSQNKNDCSDQNKNDCENRQFQANADLFALLETPPTSYADPQTQTVQQQPGTNENVLKTRLSFVESWLMENSNKTEQVSPLPEPVGQDNVSPLTFDFETFLND
ncbi:unnamed protein product [Cochlearia groenlandica]